MNAYIGNRLRFFRKRANLSQLALETEAGMASGVISRIENNQVNATKETMSNLVEVLQLTNEEIDYLIGKTALPATVNEIEKAKFEVYEELNKDGNLAYLLDDRWRLHAFSKSFTEFLRLTSSELEHMIGKTTVQLILNDSPLLKRLDRDIYLSNFEGLYRGYLPLYFANMSHMDDDEIYKASVKDIMSNDLARKIWMNLTYDNDRKYAPQESRVLFFNIEGDKFPLYYSIQPLFLNSRFVVVEYRKKDTF